MAVDKDLLLSLTRQVLDLKEEKKRYNTEMNDQIKNLEKQISNTCKE